MSQLSDALLRDYTEHYGKMNECLDPRQLSQKSLNWMEATYGSLVRSLPAGSRVLDLGCGTGFLLYWLSQHDHVTPTGVDASSSQVAAARQFLPEIDVHLSDGLEYLRQHPRSFDAVFCLDVLEHIPGDDGCFEWVRAVLDALRPGGFFVCRSPNAANLVGCYSRYMDLTHVRSFTSTSLVQLLRAAGFQDCDVLQLEAPHLTGRVRLFAERQLHQLLFRICGKDREHVFTSNVYGIGYKQAA